MDPSRTHTRHESLARDSIIELLQQLVAIPSVNPSLAPGEGTGEAKIAEFARDWLEAHRLRAWLDEVGDGRFNVIAETASSGSPTLVGCAHIDTVQTTGMSIPPFEPRLEGSRLYGRGSYDMKGGVAAVMAAAAALTETTLPGRFMVALVADEEYASIGARDFVQRYTADACILTEPTTNAMKELVCAHKGFAWLEITTHGFATHGSRWDLGVSAIAKMGRIVAALDEFDRTELRSRVHPLVGPASMHCALISGGSGLSTFAAECRLQVERRTLPGETAMQVVREIEQVIRDAGEGGDVIVSLTRPPLTVDSNAAIARCARAALRAVTGEEPVEAGVAYWMDAALFAEAGIPTVNFGSGGAGAHEAVEWVDVDTVVQCARAVYETAQRFCGEQAK